MNPFKAFFATLFTQSGSNIKAEKSSIYDISMHSLTGKTIDFTNYKGKHILFVNVASKCGFTPQYKDLETLSNTYKDALVVIGVPCNQFGNQEPGNSQDIETFCEVNYGVTFLITEKVAVKGKNQHPLYKWLTQESRNGVKSSSVKWNFQKYLVDPKGELLDYYYSTTSPLSKKITKKL
ncbi:glutathione peroxidase [Bizionia gelidisalsuginis]|uniref:Glutathione peroxidase n=1 Tax=Bizionia gelidisalsuginis TaxID=291188 RepID=A0ABY3MEU1_9FLAO|nr:glutathione peroxidase [Bizionia gelidisalsuginis]TYC18125.1 glutathione peroxidase [Bizionia gelidisalsuginis]